MKNILKKDEKRGGNPLKLIEIQRFSYEFSFFDVLAPPCPASAPCPTPLGWPRASGAFFKGLPSLSRAENGPKSPSERPPREKRNMKRKKEKRKKGSIRVEISI